MPQTISLPQHARAAQVRAATFDEADQSIEVVWTTGADVLRYDWLDGPYLERLETAPENVRLDRLNAGAPFLDAHNAFELAAVIGAVVPGSARMEGGEGVARMRLTRAAGAADIVQNIRDGIIRNVSVGYLVHAFTRTEAADGVPALMVATDWEPVEISAVPVPADPGAGIREARRGAAGLEVHPCVITRAGGTGASEEARMAEKKTGTAGAKANEKVVDKAPNVNADADVPENPVNPNDNPEMVVEEVVAPEPGKIKGQPQVVDPGDAHPLPLSGDGERQLRAAARQAVADERERVNAIGDLAERAGFVALGREHVRAGTDLGRFRDLLTDKLIEARASDGGPKGTALPPEPSLREAAGNDRTAGIEMARRALGRPAKSPAH